MKIGILIPTTSNNRDWNSPRETYLFNLTLSSFINTYCKEHEYVFYIGIDNGDRIFDSSDTKMFFYNYLSNEENISISFYHMNGIDKGFLSKMWNNLFKIAYDDNCDYFFQCG